jgi:hypothetical protein
MPQLPFILRVAYDSATTDIEKEKIVRVVNIWVSKLFIDEAGGASLILGMKEGGPPGDREPIRPPFQSPYPQNLPPPNQNPKQLLLQQQQQQQGQGQPIQIAPSLFPPGSGPPMPTFRPPPSFGPGGGPAPPQFPFPSNQQPQFQFGTFSQQALGITQQSSYNPNQPQGYQFGNGQQMVLNNIPMNIAVLDLHRISVGTMANLVKAAVKSGHPKFVPVDGNTIAHVVPPYVEPGRLEARVSEYYRKLESVMGRNNGNQRGKSYALS